MRSTAQIYEETYTFRICKTASTVPTITYCGKLNISWKTYDLSHDQNLNINLDSAAISIIWSFSPSQISHPIRCSLIRARLSTVTLKCNISGSICTTTWKPSESTWNYNYTTTYSKVRNNLKFRSYCNMKSKTKFNLTHCRWRLWRFLPQRRRTVTLASRRSWHQCF